MAYDLLKRRIKYKGDDDDALEDKNKKIDEIWINYCGMPTCFGMKEFAIVTELICHPSSELHPKLESQRFDRRSPEQKGFEETQRAIVLSLDLNAFNNYPWGNNSYFLTVEYLVSKLSPKTNNLYGFPWAFMAWAFEAIPYLEKQFNDYSKKFQPRILRWLSAKNNPKINFVDLFDPPRDIVIYWMKSQIFVVLLSSNRLPVCCNNGSSIGRNLNNLLLFCLLPTDDLSVATYESSVVRKLYHLILVCFLPIDGPYVATDGSSVRNKIYREAPIVSGDVDDVAIDVGVDANVGVDISDAGAKSGGEHVDDVGDIYGGFTPFSGNTTSFAPSSSLCSA
ncbi:hypothetical protein H5410_017268 [Solanum commersonii]|uniref:Ulp1 protease family, C-terminal catalytic domain containing protein n=1 Tax=Solanum commersonii TaxID=4109 RepID=A0A9J5ZZV2_SOLCO|nr:hypothetical protein H5410_017268 [Solanum commersonii]